MLSLFVVFCFLVASTWQKGAAQRCSQDTGKNGAMLFILEETGYILGVLENLFLFFQCNRFLCTDSLCATSGGFQVNTPKRSERTTALLLWDANPKAWWDSGTKGLWHCAVGKLTANVAQTHWAFFHGAWSSKPTFTSHHNLLGLQSHSLCSWWNAFGEEKDAAC